MTTKVSKRQHERNPVRELRELAKACGGMLVSKQYTNSHEKLLWQCGSKNQECRLAGIRLLRVGDVEFRNDQQVAVRNVLRFLEASRAD